MPVITVIGILIIVGLLLWALGQMTFIDAKMQKIIRVVVIVIVVLWLVSIFLGVNLNSLGVIGGPAPARR